MQIGIEGNQPFRKSRSHCKVDGRGENRPICVTREACISASTSFLGCLGNQRQRIRGCPVFGRKGLEFSEYFGTEIRKVSILLW